MRQIMLLFHYFDTLLTEKCFSVLPDPLLVHPKQPGKGKRVSKCLTCSESWNQTSHVGLQNNRTQSQIEMIPALMSSSHLPPLHLNHPLPGESAVGRPLALPFSPMWPKGAAGISCRRTPNHLRLHLTTAEAHWSDTAEPGIVSNAFIHSPSHWQTLWNGWNPSLVKLAQKPSFLDPFHFRELCHMLTVIHEALLAQRGGLAEWVFGGGGGRENGGVNREGVV